MLRTQLLILLLSLLSSHAFAQWTLDAERSSLSFVSIKAGNIAETHRFNTLSGHIDEDGNALLTISTASIDTLIPIRDERMQEFLFATGMFPDISMRVVLSTDSLEQSKQEPTSLQNILGTLTIRDKEVAVQADVMVANLSDGAVLVTSTKPILLNASAVGLDGGVEKLRELAGLPSISQAVPVIFTLVFTLA